MMNTKPCPECDKWIPANAVKCRCGWEAKEAHVDWIPCCFAGCPTKATLRQKTKTGWANICEEHAIKVRQKEADDYCKSLGLLTVADKRAWLKGNPLMVKRKPIPETKTEKFDDLEEESIPF